MGIDRETVGRYLRLAESKPVISTHGSGRPSSCLPWPEHIEVAVAAGLSTQRIYQDLLSDHGFGSSYQAVKRLIRSVRRSQHEPSVRIEVEPGAEAQVDFGLGAWVSVRLLQLDCRTVDCRLNIRDCRDCRLSPKHPIAWEVHMTKWTSV